MYSAGLVLQQVESTSVIGQMVCCDSMLSIHLSELVWQYSMCQFVSYSRYICADIHVIQLVHHVLCMLRCENYMIFVRKATTTLI